MLVKIKFKETKGENERNSFEGKVHLSYSTGKG